MMLVLYLASLVRSILALHDLIDNKQHRQYHEAQKVRWRGAWQGLRGSQSGAAEQRRRGSGTAPGADQRPACRANLCEQAAKEEAAKEAKDGSKKAAEGGAAAPAAEGGSGGGADGDAKK